MLDQNIDSHRMLLVFLVDRQCLFIQPMIRRNLGNLPGVVVLELVDIANDLALVCADCSQEQKVLEVTVVAKWRGLDDNLLKKFDQLNWEISREERLDGY